jgi:hypothetical protein
MKIVVPESLYKSIKRMANMHMVPIPNPDGDNGKLEFVGPYGEYEIVPRPDIEYTVERMEPVRRYSETE